VCLLDCSKAFDRLEYVQLFKVLVEKSVCPFAIRVLLQMYCNQRACVKWRSATSEMFPVSNGVKQGGVISPILFTLYMDVLLHRLEANGVGCWLEGQFCGAFAYADDVILLAPSRRALTNMLEISSTFAIEFNVIFNATKSKLLLFGISDITPVRFMHGDLEVVPHDKHLGIPIGHHCNKILVNSLCNEIMSKTNMLRTHFFHLPVDALYFLFKTYCTPLYGCCMLDLTARESNKIFVTWRKAIRFLFQLPATTHCNLLPLIVKDISIEFQLHVRIVKFYSACNSSPNKIIRLCAEKALLSSSRFARSLTLISRIYNYNKKELPTIKLHPPEIAAQEVIDNASVIRDLLYFRRESIMFDPFMSRAEIELMLFTLCTM